MPTKTKSKPKGKDKSKGKGKKRKAKKVYRTAKTSDRHDLYQLSVQSPEVDAPFFARYHKRYVGRPARIFREDFCGTGFLSAHWVQMHRENRAFGVDLCTDTLAWGRDNNIAPLNESQQDRIELIEGDVRSTVTEPVDILCALNFSYSFFETRDSLRSYLEYAKQHVKPGGLIFLDAWGGAETQIEQFEEREVEDFTYVWDQYDFDPVSYHSKCKIHFEFKDGSVIKNAFVYDWRQWTLPELTELMAEAGLKDPHVLWEGSDKGSDEGNGKYRRVKRGDSDPAWIAYVVGQA